MIPRISSFANLPTSSKVGLVVVSGGGILGVILLILWKVGWIVLIGLTLVVLALFVYSRILKWQKKRKASPMERDIMECSLSTPQGVSQPSQIARLDDLRKQFISGVQKFRDAGKSLYSFPWYLIIGEPGSGKTEAIRRCNVGFPPGLQDELQGTGGTLNMDWWFTDHAVIVDTAGRLLFEEVETGGSTEWKEFLYLLKKYRPRCPINGVLLVIPADSLIRDTADEIEQKASKIARQFNIIQRALDVRFPVFVVITKSDLINGFRDFFDNLDDPDLQGQILGWSNPAPIDEPYNPDFIDQHLKVIRERLIRRRLARMQEAITSGGLETAWSVDTLYAFPQSLSKISQRMARYLELIFSVGSKWSGKPLFFRGIYLTSSMREGSALDEDLAESLGVSVDSLPDGRAWERDRSFFLRDLFKRKVFPEQGLVTHARNAKSHHTRRKLIVQISAVASVVLILLLTFSALFRFKKGIGDMEKYLNAALVSEDSQRKFRKIQVLKKQKDQWGYVGRSKIFQQQEKAGTKLQDVIRSEFSSKLADVVSTWEKKGISWISAPAGIRKQRVHEAQAVIYETNVLKPFVEAACYHMTERQSKWTNQGPEKEVLRHLLRIRAGKLLDEDKKSAYSSSAFLDPLAGYVWRADNDPNRKNYDDDKVQLHKPLSEIIYDGLKDKDRIPWPPVTLTRIDNLERAIENGVNLFSESLTDPNQTCAQLETVINGLNRFNIAEEEIHHLLNEKSDAVSGDAFTVEQLRDFVESWKKSFEKMRMAKERIDRDADTLKTRQSLAALRIEVDKGVRESCDFFLNELGDANESGNSDEWLGNIRKRLEDVRKQTINKLETSEKDPNTLDREFWIQLDGRHLYEIRYDIYKEANDRLSPPIQQGGIFEVVKSAQETQDNIESARSKIDNLSALDPGAFRLRKAAEISKDALIRAKQRQLHSIVKTSLEAAPESDTELIKLIEREAKGDCPDVIPKDIVKKEYDLNKGATILRAWRAIERILSEDSLPDHESLYGIYKRADGVYTSYAEKYLEYWLDNVPDSWVKSKIQNISNWESLRTYLEGLDYIVINDQLRTFGRSIEKDVLVELRGYISDDRRLRTFRANLDKVEPGESSFQGKCDRMLKNWSRLSKNAFEARDTLLRCKPFELSRDYFADANCPKSPDGPLVGFVDTYWSELARLSLSKIVDETQRKGEKACEELAKKYGGKFPLAADGIEDVDPEELNNVHSLLRQIMPWEKYDEGTIGSGAQMVPELLGLQELFEKLCNPAVPDNYRTWFDKEIKQVFQGIPEGKDQYYCTITLMNQIKQEPELIESIHEFRVFQEEQMVGASLVKEKEDNTVATIRYPGESIHIKFYQYVFVEGTEPLTTISFPKPWACLRMLHKHFDSTEGKGYIRLDDEKLPGTLLLKLAFFRKDDEKEPIELPDIDNWPSLKK